MDGSLFFWLGGALVLVALGIAAIGIRGKASFPPNRAVLVLGTAAFAVIVAGTSALAVVNAQEEQEHRDKELAEEEEGAGKEASEEGAATEAEGAPSPGGQPQEVEPSEPPPPSGASALNVTSPDDGGLIFEPDGLEAMAGNVTITYSNPSAVPHSLAVESADGDVLGETQVFSEGEEEVTLDDLAPGAYVFFCTVPGHREGGMQGDLTVN